MFSALILILILLLVKYVYDVGSKAGAFNFYFVTRTAYKLFIYYFSFLFLVSILGITFTYWIMTLIQFIGGIIFMIFITSQAYKITIYRHKDPMAVSSPSFIIFIIAIGLGLWLIMVIMGLMSWDYDVGYYPNDFMIGYYYGFPIILYAAILGIAGTCVSFAFSIGMYILAQIKRLFTGHRSHLKTPQDGGDYYNTPHVRSGRFSFNSDNDQDPSDDILRHYQEHGMDSREIDYFRKEMGIARDHILSIQRNFNQTAKLRSIEMRNNTIKVCQTFFKNIVDEPERLAGASQFLYKFLPSLDDLIAKYNEVNGHVAKNKQTYQILDKTAQMIELVCVQISDEYIFFHKNTYNELNDEIKLAELNLRRRQVYPPGDIEVSDDTNPLDDFEEINHAPGNNEEETR